MTVLEIRTNVPLTPAQAAVGKVWLCRKCDWWAPDPPPLLNQRRHYPLDGGLIIHEAEETFSVRNEPGIQVWRF